jgi:hypothetical protein
MALWLVKHRDNFTFFATAHNLYIFLMVINQVHNGETCQSVNVF